MNEPEYLACTRWKSLVDILLPRNQHDVRRWRLLASGCVRQAVWNMLSPISKNIVELAEGVADRVWSYEAIVDELASLMQRKEPPPATFLTWCASRFLSTEAFNKTVQRMMRIDDPHYHMLEFLAGDGDPVGCFIEIAYDLEERELAKGRDLCQHIRHVFPWPGGTCVSQLPLPAASAKMLLALTEDYYFSRHQSSLALIRQFLTEHNIEHLSVSQHILSDQHHLRGCWALDAIISSCRASLGRPLLGFDASPSAGC
jgi:hypothetical protein